MSTAYTVYENFHFTLSESQSIAIVIKYKATTGARRSPSRTRISDLQRQSDSPDILIQEVSFCFL